MYRLFQEETNSSQKKKSLGFLFASQFLKKEKKKFLIELHFSSFNSYDMVWIGNINLFFEEIYSNQDPFVLKNKQNYFENIKKHYLIESPGN